jgi:hypothetical protein
MKKASQSLSRRHPGAVLVLGLDSKPTVKGRPWDQICIALRAGKMAAVAPKIFPTKGDGRDDGSVIIPNADDYGSDRRYVDLPSGHRALLCKRQDTFGVAEAVTGPGRRANLIRWLYARDQGARPKDCRRVPSGLESRCMPKSPECRPQRDPCFRSFWQGRLLATPRYLCRIRRTRSSVVGGRGAFLASSVQPSNVKPIRQGRARKLFE